MVNICFPSGILEFWQFWIGRDYPCNHPYPISNELSWEETNMHMLFHFMSWGIPSGTPQDGQPQILPEETQYIILSFSSSLHSSLFNHKSDDYILCLETISINGNSISRVLCPHTFPSSLVPSCQENPGNSILKM